MFAGGNGGRPEAAISVVILVTHPASRHYLTYPAESLGGSSQ